MNEVEKCFLFYSMYFPGNFLFIFQGEKMPPPPPPPPNPAPQGLPLPADAHDSLEIHHWR